MLVSGFSTNLKITFLCLNLLVLANCNSYHESETSSCPLWHVRGRNGQCECGASYDHTVKCDDNYVYILRGNCITWSNSTNSAVFYTCLYSASWDTTRDTYRIPNNVSGTKLNDITCKDYNRKGDQCKECIDGYGPAIFSDGITCTDCSKHKHLWILNLLFQIAMVCLMYLMFALIQINLTSSPLNLLVTYLQFAVIVVKFDSLVYFKGVRYIGQVSSKVLFTLCAMLNLDFLHMVLPPLCVSTNMKTVDILLFDYIIACVPLILTVFSFICIELYDRNYKLIVFLSYPIRCFTSVHQNWNPRKRILTTFVSFFLLSYAKFLFVSLSFLLSVTLYNSKGEAVPNSAILLYDPAIRPFDSEHIIYVVLTFSVLLVFVIIPTLFLVLYPTRIFRKTVNLLGFQRWDILAQIMDIFQGWYKDGLNGTRDYRPFASMYFLLRIVSCCEFFLTFLADFKEQAVVVVEYPGTGVVLVLLGALLYTVKPYKIAWMNHVDGMSFTLAGLVWLLAVLGGKIICIIVVGIAALALVFAGIYHKIYKCTKKHCNAQHTSQLVTP